MTSYAVKTEIFEGPFDLLLHLVSRQKLDINALSLTRITDDYIAHIEQMKELDLEVASEFLLLAATLLEIKAHTLLPSTTALVTDEYDDLSPDEMRGILVERLVNYKQFKNAATELGQRLESEGRMHPRQAGLEAQYLNLMPDFLKDVTLHSLATICAALVYKREVFLLEAEHVAPTPLSLEKKARSISIRLASQPHLTLDDLLPPQAEPAIVVVTFLALLELYKRGICTLTQDHVGDALVIERKEDAPELSLDSEEFDDYE